MEMVSESESPSTSMSMVAGILLSRIEAEKLKFEELYAYLGILEDSLREMGGGYHFIPLAKPLREKFEQFKPEIESICDRPVNATLEVIHEEEEWHTALLRKFRAELPNSLRETYIKLFEGVYSTPSPSRSVSPELMELIYHDPVKFSISARTLLSDIGFLNEMSGFCNKSEVFIYAGGMRKETLANCARYLAEGKKLKEAFKLASRFESGFVLSLVVHELAHAQFPELYERDIELRREILMREEEFYRELTSGEVEPGLEMESLIKKINPQFMNLPDIEKILAITIAVTPINSSELPRVYTTHPSLSPKISVLELPPRLEHLREQITMLVEEHSVLGALIEGYSAFVSDCLLSDDEDYRFFRVEREGNLKRIRGHGLTHGPSAIEREMTGARYGSALLRQLYKEYGKRGLRIALDNPPVSYKELLNGSEYIRRVGTSTGTGGVQR